MPRTICFLIAIVFAFATVLLLPGRGAAQCETDCEGQGSAILLMRAKCDLGSPVKFRLGGKPNGRYKLFSDLGAGPTVIPDAGTFCLDFGPAFTTVDAGRLNVRGLGVALTSIPDSTELLGETVSFQLAVLDGSAPNGVAISNGVSIRICEEGTDGDACIPCKPEGCTPGYWKNHAQAWEPTGFDPSDLAGEVFGVPECLHGCMPDIGGATLIEALSFQGGDDICGGAEILLRAAVASLLNAAHPDVEFPRTAEEIITATDAALATCDRQDMIDLGGELDEENNLGCPLGNGSDHESEGGDGDDGCNKGVVSIGYLQAAVYKDGFPATVTVRVYDTDHPDNILGEVTFEFDPADPPAMPIEPGDFEGFCVTRVTALPVGAVIIGASMDASGTPAGKFPDMTTFEVTVGNTTSTRDVDTSCDVPIGPGFKFTPLYITEVIVVSPSVETSR